MTSSGNSNGSKGGSRVKVNHSPDGGGLGWMDGSHDS